MTLLQLWVNGLGTENPDWTRVGTPPHLNAQDQPTNYIYDTNRNKNCGNFTFQDTPELGTINSVTLYIFCKSVASNDFDVYLSSDNLSFTALGLSIPSSWGWINKDVLTTLDTWAKINGATIYLDRRSTTNRSDVDAAYILIDYTEQVGPTPNAFNKLAFESEPPTAGAFNKLAYSSELPVPNAWNKLKYKP